MSENLLPSIDKFWEEEIIPTLATYIEIPAKSPAFDSNWRQNGYLHKALELVKAWITKQNVPELKMEVLEDDGRTPLLLLELPGNTHQNVLMYGHLDKQPEMVGWSNGLHPWKAVRREDRLYGRGGADDGYAVFACVCAMQHLIRNNLKRPNIKVAIEFSEESGSIDLPYYFDTYAEKFGTPDLVICLDSGTGNYEQFWITTSLRGLISGKLTVEVLNEGVHSGYASGIVPSSFRVARLLLDRIENSETGEIILDALKAHIPSERREQAVKTAEALGNSVYETFPFADGAEPVHKDAVDLLLNRTWRAALSIVGAEGLPPHEKAGNVLRPFTSLKLSMRLPPTVDATKAAEELKRVLETDPPYNARVEFKVEDAATGWNAPSMNAKIENLMQEASRKYFNKDALTIGEGGSIPFMGMLGQRFPKAQFVITGVLGPNSNAHGPNEFIHLDFAKKLTACITYILAGL